eukprot:Blabericola_migrator_1__4008@NODE_2218_length_3108_cov_8_238737_g1397_i0_p2_GENE_NODE_2218_length_3108_cov_8_238737_g1397_i0NODE_2218_length_3108_cov_8_238737_g1397_i0_p2_ORF_typecomplete_len136_score12_68_NODE_2218_length_3108_cov_8_238737_g1397_i07921199
MSRGKGLSKCEGIRSVKEVQRRHRPNSGDCSVPWPLWDIRLSAKVTKSIASQGRVIGDSFSTMTKEVKPWDPMSFFSTRQPRQLRILVRLRSLNVSAYFLLSASQSLESRSSMMEGHNAGSIVKTARHCKPCFTR